jgi:hypothetical protein
MRPDLYAVLMEIAAEREGLDARHLTKWLSENEGRVTNGMSFERDHVVAHGGAIYWILKTNAA